jgi:hypothetical protein
VAIGLSPARLREQLALVARLNDELAPFRVLTGIEVDICEDGSLDQDEDLLAEPRVAAPDAMGVPDGTPREGGLGRNRHAGLACWKVRTLLARAFRKARRPF